MSTFRRTKGHVASRIALPFGTLLVVVTAAPWWGTTHAAALDGVVAEGPLAPVVERDLVQDARQALEVSEESEESEESAAEEPPAEERSEPDAAADDPTAGDQAGAREAPPDPLLTRPLPPPAPVRPAALHGVDRAVPPMAAAAFGPAALPASLDDETPPAPASGHPPARPRPRPTPVLAEQLYALALPDAPASVSAAAAGHGVRTTPDQTGLPPAVPLVVAALGVGAAGRSAFRVRRRMAWRRGLPGLAMDEGRRR